jgi:hypothetical protein
METLEKLIGNVLGGLYFSIEKSEKQYQLATRAVDLPAGGLIDRAVFVAVAATDALVEGTLPFFQFVNFSHFIYDFDI